MLVDHLLAKNRGRARHPGQYKALHTPYQSSPPGRRDWALSSGLTTSTLLCLSCDYKEGTIHIEQVLEYNRDPDHLRDAAQLSLLQALDCDVELVVRRAKSA